MDLGLKGRKALVCASSQGLGLACATALAQEGCEVFLNGRNADKLAAAVGKQLGKKVSLHTRIGAVNNTAHAASVAEQAARQQAAELAMENDPFVQTLKREFGATIVPGSVRPL